MTTRRYPCSIVEILDGRSFVADVDLGFHLTIRQKFFLAGIQAPSLRENHGLWQLNAFKTLVDKNRSDKAEVIVRRLTNSKEEIDKGLAPVYSAILFLGDSETAVNQEITQLIEYAKRPRSQKVPSQPYVPGLTGKNRKSKQ